MKKNKRGTIKYPTNGNNLDFIDSTLLQSLQLDMNRVRGKQYENIAYSLVMNFLNEKKLSLNIIKDKHKINTPYGIRRFDLFIEEEKIAIEVKSYYLKSTKFIKEQILKDNWCKSNIDNLNIWWFLFEDGTSNIKNTLVKNSINYFILSGDFFEETNT